MQILYQRLDDLTDLEFEVELQLLDIEALTQEPRNTHHHPHLDCLCPTCLTDMLEHWQHLMELQKMIRQEIHHILED